MRLIDADTLKKAIIKHLCVKSENNLLPAERSIYNCIDDQPTIKQSKEQQPKWIPVSERKPKSIANKVIVYIEHDILNPQICCGHYDKFMGAEIWYDLENGIPFSDRGFTVTHWMPMPKSPEGKKLCLY